MTDGLYVFWVPKDQYQDICRDAGIEKSVCGSSDSAVAKAKVTLLFVRQ